MVAIICGCSSRIRSAALCGSIKLSVSIPLAVSRVSRISSSRLAARSSPSALTSTERRYSLALTLRAANCSASCSNSASTSVSCLLEIWRTLAIAALRICTSRWERCLNTSAARSSPMVISRMTLLSVPVSVLLMFVTHPTADDQRDDARIVI